MTIHNRARTRFAWLAALLGATEFAFRALLRTKSDWLSDLAAPYTSSRLWLAGANPYDPHIFLPAWYAGGAPHVGVSEFVSGTHSVYPPFTLLAVAPLALLHWPDAVHVFVALGLLLYAAAMYGLLQLGWPRYRSWKEFAGDPAAVLFTAFSLGFAPVHTAFHSENIVLLAACAAILCVVLLVREREWPRVPSLAIAIAAGAAATAAICIKPTTGVFLVPWLVRERRWRLLAGVVIACGVVSLVSIGPLMAQHDRAWLTSYSQNVTALFSHGGNADVSAENTENTDRIDVQLVLYTAFHNRSLATVGAALIYAGLLVAFFAGAGFAARDALVKTVMHARDLPLLVAAGSLALGLLPIYSRVYSAIVLLPLALWCFGHLRFSSARWLLLLLADFLLNTSAITRKIGEATGVIEKLPRLWTLTVGGHTCWLLLGIGCLLVQAVHQQRGESSRA